MKITLVHTLLQTIIISFFLISKSVIVLGQCTTTSPIFVGEGLPEGFDSTAITIESIQLPFPTLTGVADSNEVYIFGGQPFALDVLANVIVTGQSSPPNPFYYSQFTPYIVKLNPLTMDTIFLSLPGGEGIPYLGGLANHSNGYMYAIAQARLYKINPIDMSILQFIDMPIQGGQFMIYNGVNLTSNGYIVTKSTDIADPTQGQFHILDPETLQILNQFDFDAGTARLTFDCDSLGHEYIYHLNQNNTFRMQVLGDSLVIDTTWQAAYDPYGTGVNSEPTSPIILNDIVAYTTNTSFNDSTEPMKIFWQRKNKSYSIHTDTLEGTFMFTDTISTGFNFAGLSVDENTEVIVGQDQANGKIAAYIINGNDELEYLWEREYTVSSIPLIVGSRGMFYTNHYDIEEETDYLIILDLYTGVELGRIETPGTTPSIANIMAGANNDFYYCSNEAGEIMGYFHRISLQETGTVATDDLILANDFKAAPNPFQNQTLVTWNNSEDKSFHAQLLNLTGQVVRTYQNLTGESLVIEREGLILGVYYLKIVDEKGNQRTLKLSLI